MQWKKIICAVVSPLAFFACENSNLSPLASSLGDSHKISVLDIFNLGDCEDSRDGNVYAILSVGTLYWMTENLNYVAGNSSCYEEEDENCEKYG